ncbi:MAG: hypothetical protein L3J29_12540 [Cyclobacteriaceae bacterium]|nr:hypothetical protein [Cyclobacteriaceae bacterium]
MASTTNIQKDQIYLTSEIIVNSNGRVLNADKEFCEILTCKSPNIAHNSIILDYVVEQDRTTVVNAFIDTFYGNQEGKLFKVKMIDYSGQEIDVTFNFFPIKSSKGEKSTLLIRKKIF